MNKNTIFLIASASILLLAGCAKEPAGGGEGLRMQVAPSVAGETKGSLTAESLADFYLRVVSDDPAYSYFVHMSKDGSGAWVSPTQLLWKNESESVDYAAARFGAYAFTAADFAPGVSVDLTLPADQSTQELLDAADLLTATTVTKAYSETVDGVLPMAFSHALAKICFTLTLGPDFYDKYHSRAENPVKDFTVNGVTGDFSFVPSTGEVTAGDTPVEITPMAGTFTPSTVDTKSAKVTYEAIVVPKIINPGMLKVAFRVGDYSYSWTNSQLLVFSSGQSYEIPVSAATAPPAQKNGHEFVALGDGHNWATANLGAAGPAEAGDYFAWAEKETKTAFGWGTYAYATSDDWKSVSKYTVQDDYMKGCWYQNQGSTHLFVGDGVNHFGADDDPATYNWGSPWRVPSTEDWNWLLDSANCSLEWTDNYHGVAGLLVTSKVPGYEGNQIFLPAAGSVEDSSVAGKGSNGAYWSSWLCFNNVSYATIYGAELDFVSSKEPAMGYKERCIGLSVRAIFD